MKKRTFVSIALAVTLVLALAAPAFAYSMSYQAGLEMDGTIDREMQAGHLCNTGAEMKQTITGTGTLTKATGIAMVQGKLTVSDTNDFVTAADAVRNLTVTSVIELCAPPKMTYEWGGVEGVVSPLIGWYGFDNMPRQYSPIRHLTQPQGLALGGLWWSGVDSPQDFDSVHQLAQWGGNLDDYEDVSKQIWAAQVEANPGFSGNLHQRFEAAYGPFEGIYGGNATQAQILGFATTGLPEDPDLVDSRRWTWMDDDGATVQYGADYVGNYFAIGQMARTSNGVVRRFIDISSPWSHAYLMEDMTVTGMAEISETFMMGNLDKGDSVDGDWWDLF